MIAFSHKCTDLATRLPLRLIVESNYHDKKETAGKGNYVL